MCHRASTVKTQIARALIPLKPAPSVPQGCNAVKTRLARALIPLKPAWVRSRLQNKMSFLELMDFSNALDFEKVYNVLFLCFNVCPSPRVIIYCFAVRTVTHDHTRAWQSLKHGKECFILSLIALAVSWAV